MWWNTGIHETYHDNSCLAKQLETINWGQYKTFEEAWAAILTKCNQASAGACNKNQIATV